MAVEFDINADLIINKLNTSIESASLSTLETMVEDIRPYVPYDTGELDASVVIDESSMSLVWTAEHADYVYDMHKSNNFKRDVHPLATSEWALEARQAYERKWVDDFKKSFRGSFGGDD